MAPSSIITKIAKKILKEIKATSLDKIDLEKYCYEKLKEHCPKQSNLELVDEVPNLLKKAKFYLNKWIEACTRQGIAPSYEFNHFPPNLLIHYSIKHGESSWLAQVRKQKTALIQAINEISWQDFENLCKSILKQKGINQIQRTAKNQEGVDFCGLVNIGGHPTCGFIPTSFEVRIIGQVKHVAKKITPIQIRSFHTYYESVQRGDTAVTKKLPQWFTSVKSPILCIFMTTSSYTHRASDFAKQEWIILKTGEQIAEDLITSPDAKQWFTRNKRGQLFFDPKSFGNFFHKPR